MIKRQTANLIAEAMGVEGRVSDSKEVSGRRGSITPEVAGCVGCKIVQAVYQSYEEAMKFLTEQGASQEAQNALTSEVIDAMLMFPRVTDINCISPEGRDGWDHVICALKRRALMGYYTGVAFYVCTVITALVIFLLCIWHGDSILFSACIACIAGVASYLPLLVADKKFKRILSIV